MILDHHREEWERSGVAPSIIERNVWSIEDPRELDELLNQNTDRRWQHSAELVPGWAVAGVDASGERTNLGAQYKPDHPRAQRDDAGEPKLDSDGNPKRIKYESPRKQRLAPLLLEMEQADYWANVKADIHTPILITEGAKKAGSALTQGFPCISLPGVSTGQKLGRLRPELLEFCGLGRRIYLAFDSDLLVKPSVQNALDQLGRLIAEAGAVVSVVQLPPETKGLDDFLVYPHDIDVADVRLAHLLNDAPTLEEWRKSWREERAEAKANGDLGAEVDEYNQCKLAKLYAVVKARIGEKLRYNLLKDEIELEGEKLEIDEIQLALALRYNMEMRENHAIKIVSALARDNAYHPVEEYLLSIEARYPGANPATLDEIAPSYFGTSDPLHRCFLRKTMIAAVARALEPGCKVDTVLILQGAQGVGKSSFFRRLMPTPDWFDDSLGDASDKDERLKLHKAWVLEWGELERLFSKRDDSRMKAFISTQVDNLRPPYGRGVKAYERRSIFVGSTNKDEFLQDETGNRRWWVVPVDRPVPLARLDNERDLLWAAAIAAYRKGERWELPPEMRELAAAAAAAYAVSDPWAEAVLSFCEFKAEVQIHEILGEALKLEYNQQNRAAQHRVGAILKQAQWISRRGWINGKRPRIWLNPKYQDSSEDNGSNGSQSDNPAEQKDLTAIHLPIHCDPVIHSNNGSQPSKPQEARSDRSTDPLDPLHKQTSVKTEFIPGGFAVGCTVSHRDNPGWIGVLKGADPANDCALVRWSFDNKPVSVDWEDLTILGGGTNA